MSAFAAVIPQPSPVPLAPASCATLTATIVETDGGGALVTIGAITCPYANARMAREHLKAMEARGIVRIDRKEPQPC